MSNRKDNELSLCRLVQVNCKFEPFPVIIYASSGGGIPVTESVTPNNVVTFTNKTMDYDSNTFLNFPSATTQLSALTDVLVSGVANGQYLQWNQSAGKWEYGYSETAYSFCAKSSTTQTVNATTESTLTLFNNAILNDNSGFDTSTGVFAPSIGGWYLISGFVSLNANASDSYSELKWTKAGQPAVVVDTKANGVSGFNTKLEFAMVEFLSSSDSMHLSINNNGASSVGVGSNGSYFSAFRIRG